MEHHVSGRIVNIYVPGDAFNDLKKMNEITKSVLGKLGCGGCHSGFDLRFRHLLDFVVNAKGEVQEQVVNISHH